LYIYFFICILITYLNYIQHTLLRDFNFINIISFQLAFYPIFWLVRIDEVIYKFILRRTAKTIQQVSYNVIDSNLNLNLLQKKKQSALQPTPYNFWLMFPRELML